MGLGILDDKILSQVPGTSAAHLRSITKPFSQAILKGSFFGSFLNS